MKRTTLLLTAALLALSSVAEAQFYNAIDVPIVGLTNSAVAVRSVPAPLLSWECYNPNAVVSYIQVFDVSTSVTVGTTPNVFFMAVQPGQSSGTNQMPTQTGSYSPTNPVKVAATTTPGGGTAPTSALACDFVTR